MTDELDELIRRQCERFAVPALALGVLHEGRTELHGHGVEADTRFRIASITKPFTARLALELLDADAPALEGLRLRHLLAHTSGLQGELGSWDDVETEDDLVAAIAGLPRWHPPGELWAYCNSGYWLAGILAGRAAGTSYEEAMHDRVLAPLGLAETSFELGARDALGHDRDGTPIPDRYLRLRRPSGGLVSTVSDLLRFAGASFERRALETPAVGCDWGLGWQLEQIDGVQVAGHDGSYGGFASRLVVVPERRFALALLANGDLGGSVNRRISASLLGERCGLRRPRPVPVELREDELAALAGVYRRPDARIRLEPSEGGLRARGAFRDPTTGDWEEPPPLLGRPLGGTLFGVLDGDRAGERFDFPRPGLVRFGLRLAERGE